MTAIGDPLCSAEGAHEYLGRKAEAIVTSVQNGDNSPSGDSPTGGRAMSALNSKADERANISLSLLCAKSGHTQSGELHPVASVAARCRFSSATPRKV